MQNVVIRCGYPDCSKKTYFDPDLSTGGVTYPASWKLWYEDVFLEARCPRHRKNSCDEEGSH